MAWYGKYEDDYDDDIARRKRKKKQEELSRTQRYLNKDGFELKQSDDDDVRLKGYKD